jgi:PAS domain S-box-containing protein
MDTSFLRSLDVLIVEDNPPDADLYLRLLRDAGLGARAEVVRTAHEVAALTAARNFQVVLAGAGLPGSTGFETLELLQQLEKEIPVILIAPANDEGAARDFIRKGGADYVVREHLARLPLAVQQALERRILAEQRGRAEQRLREAEKRFHKLAELLPDPLLVEADEALAFANAAAARLLLADGPAQLVGQRFEALVHPDSRALVRGRLETLDQDQEAEFFEAKLQRLDGKALHVRMAVVAWRYQDQPAVQILVRDVTERKRVEEAIQSLAAFAQFNPNPVLEFGPDGKLTYCNEAARQMARSLGKEHPAAMLPPETASLVQACLTTGQKNLHLEKTISSRTFAWSFFPIGSTHQVHGYVEDITERLNLEAQLRHAQKLESVGRLAAGVAHDINNILTVIQGHAGLLRSEPNLRPEMTESLQQVARAAERASRLTNQLLTFSRKTPPQPQRLDLNEVLTNLSSMLRRTLGEDITFQFNYAANLPCIHADLGMIEQVIMNLAVNARDAMPKGGQLLISTAPARVDAAYVGRNPEAREGTFVCLAMTDTGCGMDQTTLGRLFEPFFTTKEFGKGTGLGLTTVYGIVKRHQGWIEVQSQPGQGSTFKLYFPPGDRAAERGAERPSGASVPGGQETILVVEDETPVLYTLRNVLTRYGYRVLEAASGIEALAVWHSHHEEIALLLTDMVMPVGLNGQELAEKFKAQKPSLKVIYTSGYSVEVAGKNLSLMDGVNFLQKPFDVQSLGLAVRKCLDG